MKFAAEVHGAMISGGWVCALHVRTAGLGGAALGSDEEEIVYLAYVVIDVLSNQVSLHENRTYLFEAINEVHLHFYYFYHVLMMISVSERSPSGPSF